ncbi:MAG: Hpt domain-containing protein [Oscillospiraceae bacterium]|nr:Hpt domain-containing protein [Oscillospiraceae bacterium]
MIQELKNRGADIADALARVLNDTAFYEECVCCFAQDENFSLLEHALNQKEYNAAFDYVHTLKGVAANLGLLPIFPDLLCMTEALRSKDYQNILNMENRIKGAHTWLQALIQNGKS